MAEVRHVFHYSEAKVDNWLYVDSKESYPKPVDNTNNPCLLEQVSMLGLTGSVPSIEEGNQRSASIVSSSSSEGYSIKADINTPASLFCIDPLLLIDPNDFDKHLS